MKELTVSVASPAQSGSSLVLGIAVHEDGKTIAAVGGLGSDVLLLSKDGETFKAQKSGGDGLRNALFHKGDLWVVGEQGYVARSPDLGKTWKKTETKTYGCLFGVVADDSGRVWIAGDDGFVIRSKSGNTFDRQKGVGESIARIRNSPLGVLIPTDDPGRLYIASDKGIKRTAAKADVDLMSAVVTTAGTLVTVGAQGVVLRSANGGKTFDRIKVPTKGMLAAVECLADGRVVAVGEGGVILLSQTDGKSFTTVKHNLSKGTLWCCQRYGDGVLIGGERGLVLRLGAPRAEVASRSAPIKPAARNPELEKLIVKSPDDSDNYVVYADWLSAQGDPRGELIAVQQRLGAATDRKAPDAKALAKRESEILRKNKRFIPDVAPDMAALTWRWGFIDSVKLRNEDDWGVSDLDVAGIVNTILAAPASLALRHLRIGVMRWDNVAEDIRTILHAAAASPVAKTLRRISIGDLEGDNVDTGMYEPGKIEVRQESFPALEALSVHGNEYTLTLDLPNLRELSIETCGLRKKVFASLLGAEWPKLTRLNLWFGAEDYGAQVKLKDLGPILDGSAFRKVKHLGLMNAELTDEICKALPASKVLKRLETLDLSLGTMGAEGVKAIVDARRAFAHLASINVSENFLTKKDLALLKTIGPLIVSSGQKDIDEDDDEGDRYVTVSE